MKNPICSIHNIDMYLSAGSHRESGGFVDNYWYCGEKNCKYISSARNREEAERQTPLQLNENGLADFWVAQAKKI